MPCKDRSRHQVIPYEFYSMCPSVLWLQFLDLHKPEDKKNLGQNISIYICQNLNCHTYTYRNSLHALFSTYIAEILHVLCKYTHICLFYFKAINACVQICREEETNGRVLPDKTSCTAPCIRLRKWKHCQS